MSILHIYLVFVIITIILLVIGFEYQSKWNKRYKGKATSNYTKHKSKFLLRDCGKSGITEKTCSIDEVKIEKNIVKYDFITRECGM